MTYVPPTATLSGICNLRSPIAICTLNVYETGAAFPSAGSPRKILDDGKRRKTKLRALGLHYWGVPLLRWEVSFFALVRVVLGFAISVCINAIHV